MPMHTCAQGITGVCHTHTHVHKEFTGVCQTHVHKGLLEYATRHVQQINRYVCIKTI